MSVWLDGNLRRRRILGATMAAAYLVTVAVLLPIIMRTSPHFSYTLDDPYIHLELARNIAQGHYGVNAAETSSPSSSVLWPLLLVPLARTRAGEWFPLLLNAMFSLCTCFVVGRFLEPYLRRRGFSTAATAGVGVCLVLAANMPG